MDSKLPYTLVGREPLRTVNDVVSNLPATRTKVKPAKEFLWRSATGQMTPPRALRTTHLFNIVSMIWNHALPEDAKTHNYIRHEFGPFYSAEYMERGIRACLCELIKRNDLQPYMQARLDFMINYLRSKRPDIAVDVKAITATGRLPE